MTRSILGPAEPPSTAQTVTEQRAKTASRVRTHRAMKKMGLVPVRVMVHRFVLDQLVARGELNEADLTNKARLGALLGQAIEDHYEMLASDLLD